MSRVVKLIMFLGKFIDTQGLWPSGMAFALHLLRLLVKDPGFDPLLLHTIFFCFAPWFY